MYHYPDRAQNRGQGADIRRGRSRTAQLKAKTTGRGRSYSKMPNTADVLARPGWLPAARAGLGHAPRCGGDGGGALATP